MPATIPTSIPEDKALSFDDVKERETNRVIFKLIKVFTDNNDYDDLTHDYNSKDKTDVDKSHTQLFYDVTDKQDYSKCKPSYSRDVYRPNENIGNLYWFDEALKSVSDKPTTLWSINQVKIKKSKVLRKVKRPRVFSINSTELKNNSTFEFGSSENESKGYSGEISTPFDNTSIQRYRWVKYKDDSRWAFIARNDPDTSLVELRKTSSENIYDIVFMMSPPPGWRIGDNFNNNFNQLNQPAEFIGRYPSVFSNPSTYRSSTTSGFLSNRESSFSDFSNSPNSPGRISTFSDSLGRISTSSNFPGRISTFSNIKGIGGKNDQPYDRNAKLYTDDDDDFIPISMIDSEKYWQEFVLASTVVIQEEVNSNKRRLWKKKN